MRVGVDPAGDEAIERASFAIEDAQRGVARAGDLAGGLEHLLEDRLRVELRKQPAADVDQAAQLDFVE